MNIAVPSHRNEHWEPVTVNRKVTTPVPRTVEDLFPKIDRWAIGFDQMLNTLRDVADYKPSTYPPYNLRKSEDTYTLELAVAGFNRDEIDIQVANQKLTISSSVDKGEDHKDLFDESVLHLGIAKRNWTLNFALSEHIEVKSAELADGILTITLVNVVPEHLKPKTIKIK